MVSHRAHVVHHHDLDRLPREPIDTPWAAAAQDAWGLCGVVLTADRTLIGYALVAPAVNVPRGHPQAGGPTEEHAAVLMEVSVHGVPPAAGDPAARHLIRAVAAQLARRRVPCLEVFGTRTVAGVCEPPADWLLAEGFRIIRDSPTRPRLCLELTRTLRLPDLARWWQRAFPPLPAPVNPEPAGRILVRHRTPARR